ncbi:MAG: PPE family protein [Mycobacterium sp.]|uniref:PPE family protein n=1 Tax=Mycobacterium sp. TaxID=1785 RepID=UPI001ECE73FF|nr:PPE family protein [Mycobacterium sp.]MBW0018603.1 PPE family protein [Mycobacterium sp.]
MEFTSLPPEVIAALIHSGPGAEPLIEASGAWQGLGTSLDDTAGIYAGVVGPLSGVWQGPSAAAMVAAVDPYVAWMRSTAQQCQQTAASLQDAAAAFASASAAVVPVSAVTANRTRLAQLLATNRFGSNLPAIAQTEDEYQSMWANNSAVMDRYQAASAQATTLSPFTSPPSITSATGTAGQSSATSAAATPADPVSDAISEITSLIGFPDPNSGYFGLANTYANQFISSGFPINLLSYLAQNTQAQAFQGLGDIGAGLSEGESALGASTANLSAAIRGGMSAPTAAMGVGVTVGKLTAPPAVVGLLPATQTPVQLASSATPLTAVDSGFPMPPLMPPPISAGSGWRKRKQTKYEDIAIGAELKGTVMPRPPSAG